MVSAARLVTGARRCDPRPHHAGAASAALAACPSTSRVQGCMPGTAVSGWQCCQTCNEVDLLRYST